MNEIEVQIKGRIDQNWSEWLGGLQVAYTDSDDTVLSGLVRDQSALLGLLNRVGDLGLQLVEFRVKAFPHHTKGGVDM